MRKTIKRVLAGAMALGLAATMMPGISMTAAASAANAKIEVTPKTIEGLVMGNLTASANGAVITVDGFAAADGYVFPDNTNYPDPGEPEFVIKGQYDRALYNNGTTDIPAYSTASNITAALNPNTGEVTFSVPTSDETHFDHNNSHPEIKLSITGGPMVKLFNVEDGTDYDPKKASYDIVADSTANQNIVSQNTNGEFTEILRDPSADEADYSVRKGQDFGVEVTPQANFMWSKGTKQVVASPGGTATITPNPADAQNPRAKGTAKFEGVSQNIKITSVQGIVPAITVTAEKDGTDNGIAAIDVKNTKGAARDLYTGEVADKGTIVSVDDKENEGDASYPFEVANATLAGAAAGRVNSANIDIQKIEVKYTDKETGAEDTYEITDLNGIGRYEIPASVMGKMKEGTKATIKVTAALMKTVTLSGYTQDDRLTFTSEDANYPVSNNEIKVPENKKVKVVAETPIGKKFANKEVTKEIQPDLAKGVTIGEVDDAMVSIPIEIDGETLDHENTYVEISDYDRLEQNPDDARKSKEAGNDGVAASAADANNGKNTTGTESSDTTTGQTGSETPAVSTGFADDDQIADYAKPYIKAAVDAGIIKGVGNNRFDPKGSATRSAFATMIQRAKGLTAGKTTSRFADVLVSDLGEDLTNGVIACEDLDPFIVQGYPDGTFQPRKPVTRAEGILMIWRAAGKPAYTGAAKFTDLADWYAEAANWGAEQGIVNGVGGGRFDGGATLTRQDLATMLGRAIEKGIIKPAAAADDKADESKTDETKTDDTKTDEKADDSKTDESKTDEAADGEKKEA